MLNALSIYLGKDHMPNQENSRLYQGLRPSLRSLTWPLASPRAIAKSLFSCCSSRIMAIRSISVETESFDSVFPASSVINHSLPYLPAISRAGSLPALIRLRTVISDTFKACAACLRVQPTLFPLAIYIVYHKLSSALRLKVKGWYSVLFRGSVKWFVLCCLCNLRAKTDSPDSHTGVVSPGRVVLDSVTGHRVVMRITSVNAH